MGVILKSQASNIHGDCGINLPNILVRADNDVVGGKLRLETLSRLAVFRIAGDFRNGPGCALVRCI